MGLLGLCMCMGALPYLRLQWMLVIILVWRRRLLFHCAHACCDTISNRLPDTVPDAVPHAVPHTVPHTVPDALPHAGPHTISHQAPLLRRWFPRM
jgi:hypothetical protein